MSWGTYTTGLELGNGSARRLAKVLRSDKQYSGPLYGQKGLAYTATYKEKAFANTMEFQFQPNADILDEE